MDMNEFISSFISLTTLQLILVIITFKLILGDHIPPIQKSIQALVCVFIGSLLSMLIDPSVHGFMAGVISAGISFYGADYINELRKITIKDEDE